MDGMTRAASAGLLAAALTLSACTLIRPAPQGAAPVGPALPAAPAASASLPAQWQAQPWAPVTLPGKRVTRYERVRHAGRPAVQAVADSSASMLRRRLKVEPQELRHLDFSWWVPALIPSADLADRHQADSPVRVVLAFDGDRRRLPARDRMLFELAETLTGEPPPYATLMYVWDNRATPESVLPGGRSDRIRKIVVESGAGGLGSWRSYRRDIVSDFERAFGEPPGALIGMALMTDSDNTASRARAWYGELVLTGRDGHARRLSD